MNYPLISVMIPSYNYRQYVGQAVESALNQTYPNVEVIVCDNGSTDGSVAELEQRFGNDPRMRLWVNETNVGLIGNFNAVLARARGEFVLWLSADDWLLPRHLQRLYDHFQAHPALDVVYSGAYFADAASRVYTLRALGGEFPVDYADVRDELVVLLTSTCQVCLPTALFRRANFDELGPMDAQMRIASDWEIAVRLAAAGKRFGYLVEPSMCVRIHGPQASGHDYHQRGENVVELIYMVEKFMATPAFDRVRGREVGVLRLIEGFYEFAKSFHNGVSPLAEADIERFHALKRELLLRAERYEPARVRSSLISAIVPVSGAPGPALQALESIAAQTHANWEIVVIDQGPVPLEFYLDALPFRDRITVARLPSGRTAGAARNLAMQMARGEYVAYLDEDNRWLPTHLAQTVDLIERWSTIAAASGAKLIVEAPGPKFLDAERLGEVPCFRTSADGREAAFVSNGLPLNATIHHRSTIDKIGFFNDTAPILEDFDFLIRLQMIEPMPIADACGVEIVARIGLAGQYFGRASSVYSASLERVYSFHPVAPATAAKRAAHQAAVRDALTRLESAQATTAGLARTMAVLAGRGA